MERQTSAKVCNHSMGFTSSVAFFDCHSECEICGTVIDVWDNNPESITN